MWVEKRFDWRGGGGGWRKSSIDRESSRVWSRAGARVGHFHKNVLLRALENIPHDDEHHENEQAEVEPGTLELVALARREGHDVSQRRNP